MLTGVFKDPPRYFLGENALKAALFWVDNKRQGTRDELYKFDPWLDNAVQFSDNPSEMWVNKGGVTLRGKRYKIHAKFYEYNGYMVFSSQNNGNSPNLEFATLTKIQPRLFSKFLDIAKKWRDTHREAIN